VRAVDTNILVRLATRDDAKQVARAEAFVAHGAWVPHLVLAEATWVLTAVYNVHIYWSKKPHDAIQRYIRHYTRPDDLVLDPFCGSNVCVHFDVSAAPGYAFENDDAGSVFGFNDPADVDPHLNILNCVNIASSFCGLNGLNTTPNTGVTLADRFDGYGGSTDLQLEATGYFRTTRFRGRWALVDPDGHLFFSQGINHVTYAGTPDQFGAYIRAEVAKWARVIKLAKIPAE